jgi:hypothetical protein
MVVHQVTNLQASNSSLQQQLSVIQTYIAYNGQMGAIAVDGPSQQLAALETQIAINAQKEEDDIAGVKESEGEFQDGPYMTRLLSLAAYLTWTVPLQPNGQPGEPLLTINGVNVRVENGILTNH